MASRLLEAGCDVRVLSRSARAPQKGIRFITGNLLTREGAVSAVHGVAVIVHCASGTKGDVEATRNLTMAASSLAVAPHLVYVSIVGVDQLSWGYMKSKLEAERVVAESGLPWTIQRATLFYDFIFNGAEKMAKLPVIPVPANFLVQPIDPEEVVVRLAGLALADPAGRVPDMGGPEISSWADMLRTFLRASHRRRPVVQVWLPGLAKVRSGGLLVPRDAGDGHVSGRRTWEDFLTARLA